MFSHILFDLDGTLTAPALGITNSFIHALKSMGKKIPPYSALCSFIGPPLKDTFKYTLGFTDAEVEEGVLHYREDFSVKGLFENSLYEGITELLEELCKNGKALFIATSKPETFSIQIAEHFGIAKYFKGIFGSTMDQSRASKESVIAYALEKGHIADKKKALMVGDRIYDIEGARKNGIASCGVLFGYGSRAELENAGADFFAKDMSELCRICLG